MREKTRFRIVTMFSFQINVKMEFVESYNL